MSRGLPSLVASYKEVMRLRVVLLVMLALVLPVRAQGFDPHSLAVAGSERRNRGCLSISLASQATLPSPQLKGCMSGNPDGLTNLRALTRTKVLVG